MPQRTPSPTKRKRTAQAPNGDGDSTPVRTTSNTPTWEQNVTPRPLVLSVATENSEGRLTHNESSGNGLEDDDVFSAISSRSAGTSTSTSASAKSRKGASSPAKREVAMHYANSLHLDRRPLDDGRMPQLILSLLADLEPISMNEAIIPRALENDVNKHFRTREYMFFDPPTTDNLSHHVKQLEDLIALCDSTKNCASLSRPRHEVEWNEDVHKPMLRMATRLRSLVTRNLTVAQIDKRFVEDRAREGLSDCRIDYGIFLAPSEGSDLQRLIRAYMTIDPIERQLNPLVCFEQDRPIVVSMETKRLAPGVEKADGQLASFGRAQLRLLQSVSNSSVSNSHIHRCPSSGPILPQLRVTSAQWELCFLVQDDDTAITYGSIDLGSTNTLLGCYRVFRSLVLLFEWAEEVTYSWWIGQLESLHHSVLQ